MTFSSESPCMVFRSTVLANENVSSIGQGEFQIGIHKRLTLDSTQA